jgi:hypothetical protein
MQSQVTEMQKALTATNNLVDAAKLQAQALVAANSPIVATPALYLHKLSTEKGKQVGDTILDGIPPENTILGFAVHNVGKSSARLVEIDIEWQVIDKLPEKPIYQNQIGINYILQTGELHEFWNVSRITSITKSEQEELGIKRKMLWVYGYVSYVDLLGVINDIGVCWFWNGLAEPPASGQGFVGIGPPAYIYERQREKKKAN